MLGISQTLTKKKETRKLSRGLIQFTCMSTGFILGVVILGPGFYTMVSFTFVGYVTSKVIGYCCVPDKNVIEYVDSDVVIVENPDE